MKTTTYTGPEGATPVKPTQHLNYTCAQSADVVARRLRAEHPDATVLTPTEILKHRQARKVPHPGIPSD